MMEISKGLQKEIVLVQNKLKNAICDHQICVGKLKDDPNNVDIHGQIKQIQLQIVSLGQCQKQVVERLRKEVEAYQAQNANGVKVSVASLLGLINNNNNINNNYHANSNNNNHITPDNDQAKDDIVQVKVQANGLSKRRRLSKDNCRNGVNKKLRAKETSTPVETLSIDDDVVELVNDNSIEKLNENDNYNDNDSSTSDNCKPELQQAEFLDTLGLITASNFDKLQNKKAERKRRSRANPQFVCSNWELPTKKKRHSYLQSGNAPQTRQTTARLNGPSPPPPPSSLPSSSTSSSNKVTKSQSGVPKTVPLTSSPPSSSSSSPCSSSLSQSSTSKSLVPAQKPVGKPNILRNLNETVRVSCNKTLENGCSTSQTLTSNSNSSKSSPSKAMNIPGLPSSLTIEKIENDVVCINCRSPGILSICDNCSASYHPSCHIISPPPQGQCPKCFEMTQDEERISPIVKKSEELEEKERERYEQRERNADLRLQVYELEKRSQLLGQSLQAQHQLKQDLLNKEEKTQKSIKRLVDFIKLMQQHPTSTQTSGSNSCQPQSSSSRSGLVPSPAPASPSQTTRSSRVRSISPITLSAARATTIPSPIHLSSSTNSPLSSPASPPTCSQTRGLPTTTVCPSSAHQTPGISINTTSTSITNSIITTNITSNISSTSSINSTSNSTNTSTSNHILTSSLRNYPILVSVDSLPVTKASHHAHPQLATVCQSNRDQQSSVILVNNQGSRLSTTVSVQLIQDHQHHSNFSQLQHQHQHQASQSHHQLKQSMSNESPKDTIKRCSTISSPQAASSPSQPCEIAGSPPGARCPDSTASYPWNHRRQLPPLRIQVHQLDQLKENDVSITYVKPEIRNNQPVPNQWRQSLTPSTKQLLLSSNQTINPPVQSTQAITSPITSPIVLNPEVSVISSLGQLSSDSTADSLKIKSKHLQHQQVLCKPDSPTELNPPNT
ncbi:mucin-5AC-like isoform X2 [Microplitis mediator]|uniref:mucin-5AC-like isoform X2 n=1 Tax=Microplitis mediator TaxID=375433 RepID=UPI00255711E7|nr:mucin-5AC-like isoform X2 [Microplitis mediator]